MVEDENFGSAVPLGHGEEIQRVTPRHISVIG